LRSHDWDLHGAVGVEALGDGRGVGDQGRVLFGRPVVRSASVLLNGIDPVVAFNALNRKWFENELIEEGKEAGVDADGQCEDGDGGKGEAAVGAQDASRESEIETDLIPKSVAERGAAFFAEVLGAAEFDFGLAVGLGMRELGIAAEEIFSARFQMELEFTFHRGFKGVAIE